MNRCGVILRGLLVLFLLNWTPCSFSASGTLRIISLVPSQTELIFAMGFGADVVGVSDFCNYPPEVESLPKLGGRELNLDGIMALRPTILVDLGGMHRRYSLFFHQVGLRYQDFSIRTFGEIPEAAIALARALGKEERGRAFAKNWETRLQTLLPKKPQGFRTYVEIWDAPLQAAGPSSFLGQMVQLAGGKNILQNSASAFPVISPEEVIKGDPELILVAYPIDDLGKIKARRGWSDIRAVRNNRVFQLDYDLFVRPGPRCLEAFRKLTGFFPPVPR